MDPDCGLPLTTAELPAVAVAEPPEWLELHALIAMMPKSAHTDSSLLTPVRRLIDAAGSTLHIVPSWKRRVTAHRHVSALAAAPATLGSAGSDACPPARQRQIVGENERLPCDRGEAVSRNYPRCTRRAGGRSRSGVRLGYQLICSATL